MHDLAQAITLLGADSTSVVSNTSSILSDASSVVGLSRAIQLSVAPVFLLTGITGLLSIYTTRLGRIIDRTRVMQERMESGDLPRVKDIQRILQVQKRRTFLINRAILCTTVTALLVSGVIGVMFISAVAAVDLAAIVVPVFVLAMASLILGLMLFLVEVQVAISQNPRRYF